MTAVYGSNQQLHIDPPPPAPQIHEPTQNCNHSPANYPLTRQHNRTKTNLAQLPGGKVLAWDGGRLYPWIRPQPRSNLHATAQGIYLLALLLNDGT